MLLLVHLFRNLLLQRLRRLFQKMYLIITELLHRHRLIAHGLLLQNISGALVHQPRQRPVGIRTGDTGSFCRLVAAQTSLCQQKQIDLRLLPGQSELLQQYNIIGNSSIFQHISRLFSIRSTSRYYYIMPRFFCQLFHHKITPFFQKEFH